MYLGIDPGHTGGAVVWDGADVRLAWEWKRVDKGYRIRTEPRVGEVVDDLSVVAMRVRERSEGGRGTRYPLSGGDVDGGGGVRSTTVAVEEESVGSSPRQ